MSSHLRLVVCVLCASATTAAAQLPPIDPQLYLPAFVPEAEYLESFYVTPNSIPNLSGPMLRKLLGAGDTAYPEGGHYAKVGLNDQFHYSSFTEGAPNYEFYVTRGPEFASLPLPPDVADINDLPAVVVDGPDLVPGTADDLAPWARTTPTIVCSKCPRLVAALEWARYLDLPLSLQCGVTGPRGGAMEPFSEPYDLDRYIEALGRDHCTWDASTFVDPDNDPATAEPAGAPWGDFSFAMPTFADPALAQAVLGHSLPYRDLLKRNLQMGVQQLVTIASHPRYRGRLLAFSIESEVHMPAHDNGTPVPRHPAYGGGTVSRPFVDDYNPVVIRQFQLYEQARYGDTVPHQDTNGDGASFWGDFAADYTSSGWTGINDHLMPTSWNQLDPPRKYPQTTTSARTRYWQEWSNFRVEVVEEMLESMVQWMISAGVPATRVFTHQTLNTASYNKNRANWANQDWMDDWIHMEVSGGFTGISIYQPFDVLTNQSYYSNLERRDDGWGAGEYNPYVVDPYAIPPLFAQPADLHVAVSETWGHRAHVLWPQFWGDVVYPAYDCATNRWERDAVTLNFAGWTAVNMAPHGVPASVLKATTTGASYLESPTVSIPAASFPFVVVDASFTYAASMLSLGPVRVDFLTQGSSNWYSVSQDIGRPSTPGHRFAVLDMSASSSWSGTVTRLRLYPTPVSGDWVHVGTFVVGGRNPLTQELHQLLLAKKDTPRPAPVAPFVVSLPFNVAAGIAPADAAGNLSVFGTEPTGGTQFNNFATAGNFFRNSAAASGGVARDAIVAAASNYTGSGADHSHLGLRKTGKFRRLELPDVSALHLSFRMGIQDGFASTDGVRYRVVLRDAARQLHELFLDEWRTNAWSAKQTVSLADWAGEIVDLAFETSSISDAVRDRSLWGEPTIERIFTLAANASGSGQLVPDPTGSYPQGTVVPLNAQASPGWIFTSWTTTGNPADIASPTSATTTITLNGHHTLTAHFAQLTTQAFESRGPDDGWVLESTATSGVGRTSNAGATGGGAVRIGDSGLDQQFKSLLSFDTTGAIPPSATLVSATLRLVRGTQVGDPTALSAIQADVAPGFFGTSAALEAVDFQSLPPNLAVNAAMLNYPAADGQVASAALSAAGLAAVNLNGLTQVRIAFATGDDANATLDYLGFHPGEAAVPADRPVLELVWY